MMWRLQLATALKVLGRLLWWLGCALSGVSAGTAVFVAYITHKYGPVYLVPLTPAEPLLAAVGFLLVGWLADLAGAWAATRISA